MINKIKIKLLSKSFIISLLAFFTVAAIASAVTTISTNIATDGALTVGGISTLTGNVGVGTASPGSALDVKGTLRLSGSTSGYVGLAPAAAAGSATYTLPNADGISGQMLSTNGSGVLSWATSAGSQTPWGSNINAAGYILYGNSTSGGDLTLNSTSHATKGDVFLNSTGGNVGIGTTSSNHKLEVRGNIFMGATGYDPFTTVADTLYLGHPRKFISSITGVAVDGSTDWINILAHPGSKGIILGTSSASDTTPHNAVNARMVIQAGGNVGIGTTTPAAKLQIESNYTNTVPFARAPELLLQNDSNTVGNTTDINNQNSFGFSNSQIQFKNVDQGYKGAILFNTRSAAEEYGERMRINESGNVGIGTTTPSSTLDILRSDANSNVLSVGRIQTGASGGGYLYFRGGAAGTTTRGYLGFTSTGGFGTPTILTGTVDNAIALRSEGYLYFGSGGDNIRMTIREDGGMGAGYVGIGTTNPAYQLQVQSAQTTGTVIGVKNTDTGGRGYGLLSSGSAAFGGAGKLYFYDDSAGIRMALDSAGNFGIATESPQSRLHIADGGYLQAEDNNAGAPPAGDCDATAELGRISIDTTNNRLYVCMGATRLWDYIGLTD